MNVMGQSDHDLGGGLLPPSPNLASEINVTPFVDVMLVLLIIFMVSAPMLTVGVPIDLPKASLNPLPAQDKPLDISIQKDGGIYVGDELTGLTDLPLRRLVLDAKDRNIRVRVRADAQVPYEQVIGVVDALAKAGITQVGLIALAKPQGTTP